MKENKKKIDEILRVNHAGEYGAARALRHGRGAHWRLVGGARPPK